MVMYDILELAGKWMGLHDYELAHTQWNHLCL
jgi:hypothetical protein